MSPAYWWTTLCAGKEPGPLLSIDGLSGAGLGATGHLDEVLCSALPKLGTTVLAQRAAQAWQQPGRLAVPKQHARTCVRRVSHDLHIQVHSHVSVPFTMI